MISAVPTDMTMIRTPDQRLRVFVSSTMGELADARAAARRAIEGLHLTPVMFELGARPYPPRDLYLAYLRQSDVFVGIYGERYGWVAPGQRVSGLEDEYLAATDKPKLVYVQAPASKREPRLAEMLQRVGQGGLSYRTFARPDELVGLLGNDLAVLLSERWEGGEPAGPAPAPTATQRTDDAAGAALEDPGELTPANRFVGRQRELAALRQLLADPQARLITLAGPGGIGKTRLAMETLAMVAPDYEAAAVADLDDVTPSAPLVTAAIAAALGVPETRGAPMLESVVGYLGSRRVLLVLDGFERVVEAAPLVARLVARAPRLTVLVTSRERLRLAGERVVDLPPLGVPAWSDGVDAAQRSNAVQLFVDRATAAGGRLSLDAAQVQAIGEICRRLDGIPLAIELAASRARMLEPDELVRRLDTRLATLTGGARDLPARQRTLRSTIAWSYDLLDEPDRVLFCRLGVFTGSFALDAAEEVCSGAGVPAVFDGISSLVDKALLHPDHSLPGQPRFGMLQAVREYAAEYLAAAGEADELHRRHAERYRRLMVDAATALHTGTVRPVVEQYVADEGNVRAAMRWFLDTHNGDSAARLGRATWPMWFIRGQYTEGLDAMEQALAAGSALSDEKRADAELTLGMMAFERGDYDRAEQALRPAVDRLAARGDDEGVAAASVALGVVAAERSPGQGEDLLHKAIDVYRRLRNRWGLGLALLALGTAYLAADREADAIGPFDEAVRIARQVEDDMFLSNGLIGLGLAHLGQGEAGAAGPALAESLECAVAFGSREVIARSLDAIAASAEATGDPDRAATFFGAADGVRQSIGGSVWTVDRARHDEVARRLHARLDDAAYRRLADRGATLALDDLLALAAP